MRNEWNSEQFEVYTAGVNSAVDPRLIGQNQLSWAMNTSLRGGMPTTRPAMVYRCTLPLGLYQGAGYFSVHNGMFVASIAGQLHKIKIGERSATTEQISLSYINHPTRKTAWFCQTVESLVIQDGQSVPIIYDGNEARRSDVTGIQNYNSNYKNSNSDEENMANLIPEVPIGRQMAYGNGRLWVAAGNFNLIAGNIRTDKEGSELKFDENTYLNGGGALYFPSGIKAMGFSPMTGAGETGALVVFGADYSEMVRADISNRDLWPSIPAFVSPLFRNVGAAGQGSVVSVNQELYWRDNKGGIRSIRSAVSNEQGSGNTPMSEEVRRITNYESQKHLEHVSSILSNNRMLMTGNPFLLGNGGVGFKSIISLDFANVSTMNGKTQPAYDGHWTGFDFVQLLSGTFNGRKRDFVVVYGEDGAYHLMEIMEKVINDDVDGEETSIVSYLEFGRKNFGDPRMRKRLDRFDIYLTGVNGPVSTQVYWRTDNHEKWRLWDATPTVMCAKTTDASTAAPHVFKLLKPQSRPSIRTFTIPSHFNAITGHSEHVGYEFQFRVKLTGHASIYRCFAHAAIVKEDPYRGDVTSTCVMDDLTGNSITYEVPVDVYSPPVNENTYVWNGSNAQGSPSFKTQFGSNAFLRVYGVRSDLETCELITTVATEDVEGTSVDLTDAINAAENLDDMVGVLFTANDGAGNETLLSADYTDFYADGSEFETPDLQGEGSFVLEDTTISVNNYYYGVGALNGASFVARFSYTST